MTKRIDDDAVKRRIWNIVEKWKYQGRKYDALLLESVIAQIVDTQPTLTPPNEPLTLEQLREMDGEPVYDYLGQEWYVIQEYYDHELTMTDGTRFFDDDEIDGVDKRFYRCPPEGEEREA